MDPIDPIEAARDVLPFWVSWAGLLIYPWVALFTSAATIALAGWVAGVPYRRAKPGVWYERARLIWPMRYCATLLIPVLIIVFATATELFRSPLSVAPWSVFAFASGSAAFVGAFVARVRIEDQLIVRKTALWPAFKASLSWFIIMTPHLLLGGLVGVLTPSTWGIWSIVLLIGGLILMTLTLLGGGIKLASLIGGATQADERLQQIVARAIERTGAAAPLRIWELHWRMANAFAMPINRELMFTSRALETLDDDQLTAITVHEIGHLDEPRRPYIARLVVIFLIYGLLAVLKPLIIDTNLFITAALILVVFGAIFQARKLGRAMEERSDAIGLEHEGEPGTYARALEELYRANMTPVVMSTKRVHPDLYDRLLAAGITPEYERPEPPPSRWSRIGLASGFMVLMSIIIMLTLALAYMPRKPQTDENELKLGIAFQTDCAWELSALALQHFQRDERTSAIALYDAASALDPDNAYYHLNLAMTLTKTSNCPRAQEALKRAEALSPSPEDKFLHDFLVDTQLAVSLCRP